MSTPDTYRQSGFVIRRLRDREREFLVDARKEGVHERKTFLTLKAARKHCRELRATKEEKGRASFDLSTAGRLDAQAGLSLLAGRCSLEESARFWLKYHPDAGAITFLDLLAKYRADMDARKVRPDTLRGLWRLERIARSLGKRAMAGITTADLCEWLDGRGLSPRNRNNYRLALSGLFNFAVRQNAASTNPVDRLPAVKVEAVPVTFWSAEQVAHLLHTAESLKPDLAPLLAVMALAGLRPAEAASLRWESVNVTEKIIRVEGATSKTRARRIVPITDNLLAWLVRYRKTTGPIAPRPQTVRRWRERIAAATLVPNWSARLAKADGLSGRQAREAGATWKTIIAKAKEAREDLWPPDILRHSFASHWLAAFHDENRLAAIMGNSPGIVHRHYKALVTEKEAAPYWTMEPSGQGKLIPMKVSA